MHKLLNIIADHYENKILPKLQDMNKTKPKQAKAAPMAARPEEEMSESAAGEQDEEQAGGGRMKPKLASKNGNNPDQENDMPRPPNGALKPAKSPHKPMAKKQPDPKQSAKGMK